MIFGKINHKMKSKMIINRSLTKHYNITTSFDFAADVNAYSASESIQIQHKRTRCLNNKAKS